MLVKVQVSKTWQEKQFEPFNLQLGVEFEVDGDKYDKVALEHLLKSVASELQDNLEAIKRDREAFR